MEAFSKAVARRMSRANSTVSAPSADAIGARVRAQLIRRAYRDSVPGQYASIGVALVLAFAAGKAIRADLAAGWCVVILALIANRIRGTFAFRRVPPGAGDLDDWRRRFIVGAGLLGVGWGAAAWLFLYPNHPALLALLSFIISGFIAGIARVFAPVLPAFFAFVIPVVAILVVTLVVRLGAASWSIVGVTLCYCGFVSWVARAYRRDVERAMRLTLHNSELVHTLRSAEAQLKDRVAALQHEIEERKKAEAELAMTHAQLVDASRQAGKAEIATNVLHNVGNVLNSAVVSCSQLRRAVYESKAERVLMVANLLRENRDELGRFFQAPAKGEKLLEYLPQLGAALVKEQEAAAAELNSLGANLEHIQVIISVQQDHATAAQLTEDIRLGDVIEHAIAINADAISRHGITVVREYADLPDLLVDRHRVLQILVNVIKNAAHAIAGRGADERKIIVRATQREDRVVIAVRDTGVGISSENLQKIFRHGYSTRRGGHGFGLHSGALTAKQLGGELRAESPGEGQGATFLLELPLAVTA